MVRTVLLSVFGMVPQVRTADINRRLAETKIAAYYPHIWNGPLEDP